jgi:Caspase domain
LPRRTALIVGNLEYQDERLSRLVSPQADVLELASVLQSAQQGQFDEVRTLFNQTHGVVTREMWRFFRSATKADDMVLLYFSGHGLLDDQGRLFLALADTETELLRATALAASQITEAMDTSRSRRQVLILDCCHSGAFERGAKAAMGQSVGTTTVFEGISGAYQQEGQGRVVLTATDATQFAWEGDNLNGAAERSVFTKHLVEGLKTGMADLNGDGWIGMDELYEYVHAHVVSQTPRQQPCKFARMVKGEFVIARRPPGTEKPVPLRADLEEDLSSRSTAVRMAAVEALTDWLRARHVGRFMAAHDALERLAESDDSMTVRAAARTALEQYGGDVEERVRRRHVDDAPTVVAGPDVAPAFDAGPAVPLEAAVPPVDAAPRADRPAPIVDAAAEAARQEPVLTSPLAASRGPDWPAGALALAAAALAAGALVLAVATLAGAGSPGAVVDVLLWLAALATAGFAVVRVGPGKLAGRPAVAALVGAGLLFAGASAAALVTSAGELALACAAVGLCLEVAAAVWLTQDDADLPGPVSWPGMAAVPALLLLAVVAVLSTLADPDVRGPLVAWFIVPSTGLCAAWASWLGATLLRSQTRTRSRG